MKVSTSLKGIIFAFICVFAVGDIFQPSLARSDDKAAGVEAGFSSLVKEVRDSVVNISTVKVIKGQELPFFQGPFGRDDQFNEFFERFFGDQIPREYRQQSLGSGFVIDEEGYILTNNHVVEKTDEIKVILANEKEYEAKVVGRDPKTDLALIKIDSGEALEPLPLGNSDALEVGDWVVAIGNPFGLGHTVTAGIVSAKYRRIGTQSYADFIQTDASINPGNSGGPLLDTEGKVVGINSAIFSQTGGSIGIGFAVPVNLAKDLLPQLKEGKVVRGWLGVMIQAITPELQEKLGLESQKGALVGDVTPDGPADKAGVKRGDVIVSFAGKEVKEMNELPMMVGSTAVGEVVELVVIRNGEKKTLEVKIGRLEEEGPEKRRPSAPAPDVKFGMKVEELTPELARRLDISEQQGLVVMDVERNSPAQEAGLRPGDLILEIDSEEVKTLSEYREKISGYKEGDTVLFLVRRGGNTLFLTLKVRG
ncbi:MAG: DegQ family serine endoprotease [Desulfobacteraceae bacterium]